MTGGTYSQGGEGWGGRRRGGRTPPKYPQRKRGSHPLRSAGNLMRRGSLESSHPLTLVKQYKKMLLENLTCFRAKIIFAGKLRNPYFWHTFGMERPFFCLKKGMYQPGIGF